MVIIKSVLPAIAKWLKAWREGQQTKWSQTFCKRLRYAS